MIKSFLVPLIAILLLSPLAQSQVCGEYFRSTPELESVLRRPFVGLFGGPGNMTSSAPNQTRLLRAVEADVLGLKTGVGGWPSRTLYSMKRVFHIIGLKEAQGDLGAVEFHRRRYEQELAKMGLPVGRDIRTRLRENRHYLSLLFSVAANGAVNYLSFKYLNTGFLVHIPETRIFNERTLPDDVLNELIDARADGDVPRTRAYVNARVKFGADEIIAAGRRMFNYGVLAVLLVTHGDMIYDPSGATLRAMDTTTSQIHEAAVEQNRQTLKLLEEKRARFVTEGRKDMVEKADALILEVKSQKEKPR